MSILAPSSVSYADDETDASVRHSARGALRAAGEVRIGLNHLAKGRRSKSSQARGAGWRP